MRIYFSLLFFLLVLANATNLSSHNIRSIDINFIIENYSQFLIFKKKLNKFQIDQDIKFKKIENKIIEKKNEIETNKIILNDEEIQKLIYNYNLNVNNFELTIQSFNNLLQKNLDTNKKIIINHILNIVTNVAEENNYDMIIDKNDYFISSIDIDITSKVLSKLEEVKIDLNIIESDNYP